MDDSILGKVENYYTNKIKQHGATPAGVDWNSFESQSLRFEQLSKVFKNQLLENKSVLDYGCGFGSLYPFLKEHYRNFEYIGFDISQEMIKSAIEAHGSGPGIKWETSLNPENKVDYVVASGIFNVKQDTPEEDWKKYIIETIDTFNAISNEGFSFNILTKYSDKEYMKDYLHYADPLMIFDYCKTRFSKYVSLIHDYPLYEFTILVKK